MNTIRTANISDIPKIKSIILDWYNDAQNAEYFCGLIRDSINGDSTDTTEQYVVYVDSEHEVKGVLGFRNVIPKFATYTKTNKPIEIYMLFVGKKYIRLGIGSALLDFLIEHSLDRGYTEIFVRSASRFKDSGWQFYEKYGFKEVGRIDGKDGLNSILFTKEIN